MVIGFLVLDIHFPLSHSLKEKRKRLNRLKDRFKYRYNVALAELDYQDKWQRSKIGIVTINAQKKVVECLFNRIIKEAEENMDGEVLEHHVHFF